MSPFTHVIIIYNPNSTGDSPTMAEDFAEAVRTQANVANVVLAKTKRAGHAEQLAYQAACEHKHVVIVSVSGDGGYHEVINGALRAVDEGNGQPICAVLPGGNANDHYSSISRRPLIEALVDNGVEAIDVLAVRVNQKQRYAHSYVGLGLTPLVAIELNRHSLSALKESWLAIKTFWRFRPFRVEMDGRIQQFDSLVFANIDKMAKYVSLAEDSAPDDGKYEIIRWPHGSKARLLATLLRSTIRKPAIPATTTATNFVAIKAMPMQLDGELLNLQPADTVEVVSAHNKLHTLR